MRALRSGIACTLAAVLTAHAGWVGAQRDVGRDRREREAAREREADAGPHRLQDFAHRRPITIDSAEGLQILELPAAVYAGTVRADAADLRVFNGANEPVPYALLPARAATVIDRPSARLPVFPVQADPAGDLDRLELRIDRSSTGTRINVVSAPGGAPQPPRVVAYLVDATALEHPVGALAFEGLAPGTFAAVRIDASDDLKDWRIVTAGASLVRLQSAGANLEQSRTGFPATRAGYFRVSWPAGGTGITLSGVTAELTVPTHRPLERRFTDVAGRRGERDGEFVFDLASAPPVDRLRFILPDPNTVSQVTLHARSRPESPWQQVGSAAVYRLQRDGLEVKAEDITVAMLAARYWMVRADPRGGGLGSTPPTIGFGWLPQRIVFAARGAAPFTLAFGNHRAGPGALAIDNVVPGYKPELIERLPVARVESPGDGAVGAGGSAAPPPAPVETKKWLLWASLVAGVAMVAFLAWRLARQMPK